MWRRGRSDGSSFEPEKYVVRPSQPLQATDVVGMQMADINLGDVSAGEALLGQASAGVAAAVDQEPPFRRIDQDIGLVVVRRFRGKSASWQDKAALTDHVGCQDRS